MIFYSVNIFFSICVAIDGSFCYVIDVLLILYKDNILAFS